MTSGQFKSFPITDIWVDRDKRQRRALVEKDILELALSISKAGLINPPVIQRSGELRAGECRFEACKHLGWTSIPVQFVEDLDEHELQFIELEENLRRTDLPWQDECLAIEKYHSMKMETDEEWNKTRTCEALGLSITEVSYKNSVAKEIIAGNDKVASAPRYSVARGIVERTTARRKASEIDVALTASPAADETVVGEKAKPAIPLKNIDFHKWATKYSGPAFNFIHCDFPYGVNADKHDQGAGAAMGGYEDSQDVYFELIETLGERGDNFIADSAHMIFWFSMNFYSITKERLMQYGWTVNPFPLIWFKTDNAGILPDPKRRPRQIYETAFFCSRGDRLLVQPVSNCIGSPTTKDIHMSEKPKPVLRQFFRLCVDEYTIMLDPTCGSANAVRVADDLNAAQVLGLEKNKEFYHLAKENYYD